MKKEKKKKKKKTGKRVRQKNVKWKKVCFGLKIVCKCLIIHLFAFELCV